MAAIVGLVASVLGPTIELGKCIVEPIKRQLNYLCCFNSNIDRLKEEAKALDDAKVGVQMRVDDAKRNTNVIVPQVVTWLDNVNAIQTDISRIESEIPNVKSGLLALKSRFLLSREARKMVEAMKELEGHGKFDQVSQPALPAAMGSIQIGQTYEIESRKHIEDGIMASLRERKVNIMGICGMGGVGKTTMAKKIMKRARDEHLFDEIVMAVVSQQVNMSKIQQDIAESLGLRFGSVESLLARAHQLRIRLMDTKKTLLVLDDLWERLNLEDIGIPHESDLKGCTILLTSRDRGVFRLMNVEKVFDVQILSDIEAWSLFRQKVGTCADDEGVFSIAQDIMKECKGLPIALVTVGVALKDKRNESLWKDALTQLKSSNPTDMPDVLRDVYSPLKLSYDYLDNEHARFVFLLCCLFPEDHDISTYDLTIYGWGLGMFEGFKSLLDAENRVHTLVDLLKSRSLLLEGYRVYYDHVKMHDIVRDVAIFIASKQGLIEPNLSLITWPHESNCTWISTHHLAERSTGIPTGLVFPNLRLLLIENSEEKVIHLDDNIFERMRELNVLTIANYSLSSLPHTTQLLRNLRTLRLESCPNVKTISFIGELVNLEILICYKLDSMKEFPVEIQRLNRLRSLEFSINFQPKTVAPGIISRLVSLEKLSIMGFDYWEGEKTIERKNARVSELESLLNLTSLSIHLVDPCLATEQMHLSPNVVEFYIHIGKWLCTYVSGIPLKSRIRLVLEREVSLGDWVHKLLRKTEGLCLEGEGSRNLVPLVSEFHKLRSLQLMNFSLVNVTSLFDGRSCGSTASIFPFLENIWIEGVVNLEEIYNVPIPSINSFKNLKNLRLHDLPALKNLWKLTTSCLYVVSPFCNLSHIFIYGCHGLHNLFSLVKGRDCVLQHENLSIGNCKMMEQVLLWNEDANDDIGHSSHNLGDMMNITFQKLSDLNLYNLPSLNAFCQGIESIEFPLLTHMVIHDCPELKSLVPCSSSRLGINHYHDTHCDESLHLFCNPKLVFGMLNNLELRGYEKNTSITSLWCRLVPIDFFIRLEELTITDCGNISSLFSFSIAQNLVNLERLTIASCREMVKVVDEDEKYCASHETQTLCLFHNLKFLTLTVLSKLKSFCELTSALELPSLKQICISNCSEMERFTLGSLALPSHAEIILDDGLYSNKHLNDVLRTNHFRNTQPIIQ